VIKDVMHVAENWMYPSIAALDTALASIGY
jgi:hypothetical protein